MEAIEPVNFEVQGSGLDLSDYSSRLAAPHNGWDETHDFILHKVLIDHFNEISDLTLMEKYEKLLEEEFEAIDGIVPWLQEEIMSFRYPPVQSITPAYHVTDVLCVPNPYYKGTFYIISNNKNKLRDIRDRVIENLRETPDMYGPLGVEDINVYSGGEFTLQMMGDIELVKSVNRGEADDFEEQIYEEVEPISEAFVHNITITFESPQEPEYDIVFSLGPDSTICIEVEDHSGTDNEPEEQDIIDNPAGKSDYINASKVFTVPKGVSSERIGELRHKSELTNVDIIERNQCSEHVLNYIDEEMLPDEISPHRTRYM